jgi:hypothetical protein
MSKDREERRQRIKAMKEALVSRRQATDPWMGLPNTEEIHEVMVSAMTADDRKSTSYHESAHAVLWTLADITVEWVSAVPFYEPRNGWVRGVTKPEDTIDSSKLISYIQGMLAGDLAQKKAGCVDVDGVVTGDVSSGDQGQLERLITQLNTQHGAAFTLTAEQTYHAFLPLVKEKLDNPEVWSAIDALAARLQEVEVVQGDEIREIVARCCRTTLHLSQKIVLTASHLKLIDVPDHARENVRAFLAPFLQSILIGEGECEYTSRLLTQTAKSPRVEYIEGVWSNSRMLAPASHFWNTVDGYVVDLTEEYKLACLERWCAEHEEEKERVDSREVKWLRTPSNAYTFDADSDLLRLVPTKAAATA